MSHGTFGLKQSRGVYDAFEIQSLSRIHFVIEINWSLYAEAVRRISAEIQRGWKTDKINCDGKKQQCVVAKDFAPNSIKVINMMNNTGGKLQNFRKHACQIVYQ